jgi:hypothetical protein
VRVAELSNTKGLAVRLLRVRMEEESRSYAESY